MKKNHREAFKLLFKLCFLIQLYSHLKSTTEAASLSKDKESVAQLDGTDGNNLNDRMSQIEAKSRRQENDISFLKAIIVEDKRTIRQLRGRVSSLESLMLAKNSETNDQPLLRQKRPYRLLPVHPGGDKMEKEKATAHAQFYGPPSNCNELGKLGYTLNGYYLVKGKDESISNSIEAVICQFNLPEKSKGDTSEQRFGLVTIGNPVDKSKAHSKEDNIELVSTQLNTKKNELKVTERNLYGFISSIDSTTTAKPSGDKSAVENVKGLIDFKVSYSSELTTAQPRLYDSEIAQPPGKDQDETALSLYDPEQEEQEIRKFWPKNEYVWSSLEYLFKKSF